jgi:hypothetical protein
MFAFALSRRAAAMILAFVETNVQSGYGAVGAQKVRGTRDRLFE